MTYLKNRHCPWRHNEGIDKYIYSSFISLSPKLPEQLNRREIKSPKVWKFKRLKVIIYYHYYPRQLIQSHFVVNIYSSICAWWEHRYDVTACVYVCGLVVCVIRNTTGNASYPILLSFCTCIFLAIITRTFGLVDSSHCYATVTSQTTYTHDSTTMRNVHCNRSREWMPCKPVMAVALLRCMRMASPLYRLVHYTDYLNCRLIPNGPVHIKIGLCVQCVRRRWQPLGYRASLSNRPA
jgi:hypothetical protein